MWLAPIFEPQFYFIFLFSLIIVEAYPNLYVCFLWLIVLDIDQDHCQLPLLILHVSLKRFIGMNLCYIYFETHEVVI